MHQFRMMLQRQNLLDVPQSETLSRSDSDPRIAEAIKKGLIERDVARECNCSVVQVHRSFRRLIRRTILDE